MKICSLHCGSVPLLVSLPHNGTEIPADLVGRMTDAGRRVADTDWHLGRLYGFAKDLGASLIVPRLSRFVVDLNRPPDGARLYPGYLETGICPLETFAGEPIYMAGQAPSRAEIEHRKLAYWLPYHQALQAEINRLRSIHGQVLLWEGHSIRSVVPRLFKGELADLSLGTADGRSCMVPLQQALITRLQAQQSYQFVVNARFKGGYITRHYGQPEQGVQAVQLEITQKNYMHEGNVSWDEVRGSSLQKFLRSLLECAMASS